MNPIKVYSAQTSYPYGSDEGMRELSLTIDYTASDPVDAIRAAIRFADDRVLNLKGPDIYRGMCVGCIKLSEKTVGPIEADGRTTTRAGFPFFEWKYDYPGTLEQYVQSFERRYNESTNRLDT
jgi:hypothetical protein